MLGPPWPSGKVLAFQNWRFLGMGSNPARGSYKNVMVAFAAPDQPHLTTSTTDTVWVAGRYRWIGMVKAARRSPEVLPPTTASPQGILSAES